MLSSKFKINKDLLPIKGHYFLFNAGTAPLVPYLSTYARQLGFSSATVGLIYTVLPICGLIAKPLFGVIADRFKIQKSLFIIFQIVTILSFSAIYFIPESASSTAVELDCADGATMLKSCYNSVDQVDQFKVTALGTHNATSKCQMTCDMTSPQMWQTVCEHWHMPEYCYSNTDSIDYSAHISTATLRDNCAFITTDNVTLDGYTYAPRCHIGNGYVDINEPCALNCTSAKLTAALAGKQANMTCVDNVLNYRVCDNETAKLNDVISSTEEGACLASCELNKTTPWRLMEICEGWGADITTSCRPKLGQDEDFPPTLTFTGTIQPNTVISEHECVYVKLTAVEFPEGKSTVPYCVSKAQYQIKANLFRAACKVRCDNSVANELFEAASESKNTSSEYTRQFWLFFMMMIISWVGQAVVVTFADAICFNLLGENVQRYGKQRLWGSVGWGIFSLLTGTLIDLFSEGAYKDYTVAFLLMFVFLVGDVIDSCFLKTKSTKVSMNILADVGALLTSLPTVVFVLWTVGVGLSTGLLWNFLFWHIEDIAAATTDGTDYVKTLQGLVSAIQTFGGEIPFMFVFGHILRILGHVNMMSVVLFAFGLRFILYSFVHNPWWILPIEIFQGVTFGMFYPTMTSYATVVSPTGTETTVQGLVGAIFEGVGVSLGSFIGGRLYGTFGGWYTFQYFGIASLALCIVHIVVQYVIRDKTGSAPQGYSSVIRYEQPNDNVYILFSEENDDSS